MKSTWIKYQQCLFTSSPWDVQMVRSQQESGALYWNWTSHPNSRGFPLVGVFWGLFFFSFFVWREGDAVLCWLGMYWLRIQLSLPAGPCAALLTVWGLNQDTNTPDGWGRTHPGFIKKTTLPINILTWSIWHVFFSKNAASLRCSGQFTRHLLGALKVVEVFPWD